ncbi:MAG TPA: hypothetical protein VIX19_00480 [Terriglobales bacterium]
MGIEFIRKAAPSFRKGLDRRRIELGTPKLFRQEPTCIPRAYAANIGSGQTVATGEKLGVRFDGEQVVALRGLDPVATFSSPPTELKDALRASHGEACGLVKEVHEIAQMVEIAVC